MKLRYLCMSLVASMLYSSSVFANAGWPTLMFFLGYKQNLWILLLANVLGFLVELLILRKIFWQEKFLNVFGATVAMNIASATFGYFFILMLNSIWEGLEILGLLGLTGISSLLDHSAGMMLVGVFFIAQFMATYVTINTLIEYNVIRWIFTFKDRRLVIKAIILANLLSVSIDLVGLFLAESFRGFRL